MDVLVGSRGGTWQWLGRVAALTTAASHSLHGDGRGGNDAYARRRPEESVRPDAIQTFILMEIAVGQDVAANTVSGDAPAPRHLIVVNWFEELKERMGGN